MLSTYGTVCGRTLGKHDIDDTNIMGWPFEKSLGGMTFWDIHDGDINKGMMISEEDSHPNVKDMNYTKVFL